jgi:hypothetical protein
MKENYKFQWYQNLYKKIPEILQDVISLSKSIGLERIRDQVGLYSGSSSCPGPLSNYVLNAIKDANQRSIYPMQIVADELREVVKDIFGMTSMLQPPILVKLG